jgi:hypothetical protein
VRFCAWLSHDATTSPLFRSESGDVSEALRSANASIKVGEGGARGCLIALLAPRGRDVVTSILLQANLEAANKLNSQLVLDLKARCAIRAAAAAAVRGAEVAVVVAAQAEKAARSEAVAVLNARCVALEREKEELERQVLTATRALIIYTRRSCCGCVGLPACS